MQIGNNRSEGMSESGKKFCVEYAKRGAAACKKCKVKIDKGLLRIAKIVPNPFTDGGSEMKEWYHTDCMFESFQRARATTKKIEDAEDLEGFQELEQDDRKKILTKIHQLQESLTMKAKTKTTAKKLPAKRDSEEPIGANVNSLHISEAKRKKLDQNRADIQVSRTDESSKDNSFKEFRKLCAKLYDESAYTAKTAIVRNFFEKGTCGKGFEGDTYLWVKFLLPSVNKRIYNLQSKQLCKLFARVFGGPIYDSMVEDLEQGDVAETVAKFHEEAIKCPPTPKANLSLQQVDRYLERLSRLTREDDQAALLDEIAHSCTVNDLKMIVRLIKHDIRINAGPKHILDALNPAAYEAFHASLDLEEVVRQSLAEGFGSGVVTVGIKICTPVKPMLAEPCRSVDFAFKRFPNGMFAEVKYDGERVQLHKRGNEFFFYSRSLKPVVAHKVNHFREYIPKAFPYCDSLIIDGEILLVNTKTDEILPFGTLGVHKKAQFREAAVCFFVFDCMFYNGKSLLSEPLSKRREILTAYMSVVKHHVQLSEMEGIRSPARLKANIEDAINKGLEGLVLKDPASPYEPGKRHWLKVKKDYLQGGTMADSADLVVLGAYFGTGNKGGIMSIFLMGCYNPSTKRWVTVTKVHGGHDDATLQRLQKELQMKKISKNPNLVPSWMDVKQQLVPDFVTVDPLTSQVWEITGAEFSKAEAHTANGISIRFPRVSRIRNDKSAEDATSLEELIRLFNLSKRQVLKLDDEVGNHITRSNDELLPGETRDGNKFNTSTPEKNKKNARDRFDSAGNESCDKSPKKGKKESISPAKILTSSPSRKANSRTVKNNTEKEITFKKDESSLFTVDSSACTGEDGEKAEGVNRARRRLPECDLPRLFTGIVVETLPTDFRYYQDLSRYFIAYDGKISKKGVTHEIGTKKGTVCIDWIWESIKRRTKVDIDSYIN